jgi:hypothetical protein
MMAPRRRGSPRLMNQTRAATESATGTKNRLTCSMRSWRGLLARLGLADEFGDLADGGVPADAGDRRSMTPVRLVVPAKTSVPGWPRSGIGLTGEGGLVDGGDAAGDDRRRRGGSRRGGRGRHADGDVLGDWDLALFRRSSMMRAMSGVRPTRSSMARWAPKAVRRRTWSATSRMKASRAAVSYSAVASAARIGDRRERRTRRDA